jgi:hypothetical protein
MVRVLLRWTFLFPPLLECVPSSVEDFPRYLAAWPSARPRCHMLALGPNFQGIQDKMRTHIGPSALQLCRHYRFRLRLPSFVGHLTHHLADSASTYTHLPATNHQHFNSNNIACPLCSVLCFWIPPLCSATQSTWLHTTKTNNRGSSTVCAPSFLVEGRQMPRLLTGDIAYGSTCSRR